MILSYIYNILKFKKWELLFFATILFALKWPTIITFRPNMDHFIELHKCPACFGTSACNYIHEVNITLNDFYSAFSYFFGVKNVFFGVFNKNKVVLKKLAQSFELNEFDRMLCENKHFSHICTKTAKAANNKLNINFLELIEKEVNLNFSKDNFSRLRLCPSVQHLNNLLQHVYHNNKDIDPKILNLNIWVLTALNPEPLLLQILPAERNWPVPKYLGACGRMIIEEYVGLPLATYYNEPWLCRAKISSSLLDAAYMFTYKNKDFGFYLTDISVDNIAVDLNNNVKFVDLENVIIVDKNIVPAERSTIWNQLQVNTEDFSCSECLAFSSAEICNHKISDHNYYAICKVLLALNLNSSILHGGLLHDIPTDILETYPNITYLVEQCVTPQISFDRIKAGMELKKLLDIILQKYT
ncbi:Deleted in autism protein 1 like protein [Habropoda laboriosa]|uniref:Deleted in autism protein 1 like protein n=1 Tax=Habropoda laboriosa TaxID=597456 RepID=A0A0L7QM61_9HYME|nr:PREDICTED: deleted in autism protein 1 homolog [Habropoda laboriosa]KOC59654.1 Deleted in autism protein 1 like protein [Habropoda laboriosa]